MSLGGIVHSERTNGTHFSGEMGTNSGDKGTEGRWMKGHHQRHRMAYNWRNNMQEFIFRESGRKRILVCWACLRFIFLFLLNKKPVFLLPPAHFCQFLLTVWCSHDASSHMVYLPRAFQTNQTNNKEEIHYIIRNSCQCPFCPQEAEVLFILLSCLTIIILVFTWESVVFMLSKKKRQLSKPKQQRLRYLNFYL